MISFFLLRGHTLDEMLSLTTAEKAIFTASMAAYLEEVSEAVKE